MTDVGLGELKLKPQTESSRESISKLGCRRIEGLLPNLRDRTKEIDLGKFSKPLTIQCSQAPNSPTSSG
jgi:hypothetical protein